MLQNEDKRLLESRLEFFPHLEERDKRVVLENSALLRFAKGDTVYGAGTECLGVLVVKKGLLRAYILSEEGREVTLYKIYPGEVCVLSASCILASITFDVHIEAEEDSEVLLLNIAAFSGISQRNVYAENFSLNNAVERFSEVMGAMEQILFSSLERRLAGFLLEEAARSKGPKLELTHEQIARNIGSVREVVSRQLKLFSEAGLVRLGRGRIELLNEKGLEEYL